MNGADSLVKTMVDAGIDVCFTNPGTTEIHVVNAFDTIPGIRLVLALFEGVATGAADGYARMTGKPAATLLHLGPGLANGLANLHNARRANSPVVNIIGDHATYHRQYDAPLASDIEGLAGPVSGWVRTSEKAEFLAADGAAAIAAAMSPPGQVATLIIPGDCAWGEVKDHPAVLPEPAAPRAVAPGQISRTADILKSDDPTVILMTGRTLEEQGLKAAGRIAATVNARLYCDTFVGRLERGAGRPKIRRLPYFPEDITRQLSGTKHLILVGTKPPVSFFAYHDKPSYLVPEGCNVEVLSKPDEDGVAALEALADLLEAPLDAAELYEAYRPEPMTGSLSPESVGAALGAFLPEGAIVSDESGTSGITFLKMTGGIPRHDWLFLTGGSIGQGMPVATGAAVACPDRKVICLIGDGGAMYTIQSLWTQARERLDVTTIVFSNQVYGILKVELTRAGVSHPGDKASSVTRIGDPSLDFVAIAKGMGINALRATTAEEFNRQFSDAMNRPGPHLIDVPL